MLSDFEMGRNFEKMAESLRKQNKFNAETKRVVNYNAKLLGELSKKHNGIVNWCSVLFLGLDLLIAWNAYDIYKLQKRVDKLEKQDKTGQNEEKQAKNG